MDQARPEERASLRELPAILTVPARRDDLIVQHLNVDDGTWQIGELVFDYFQLNIKETKGVDGDRVLMIFDRSNGQVYHFRRQSLRPIDLDPAITTRLIIAEKGYSSAAIADFQGKKFKMPML